jgi:hypothetical protein
MNDQQTIISNLYICEAFKEILLTPPAEFQQIVITPSYQNIIAYLAQLPQTEQNEPAKMANHIASFCQQPNNKNLYDWLRKNYARLNQDGINTLVKNSRDPGEEADDEPETMRLILQKSRDICQELQQLAAGQTQSNPENQDESNQN